MKRKDIKIEEGLGEQTWGRAKFTTLLDRNHIRALRRISDVTRIPMSTLIAQALDNFFKQVGWQQEPESPPIDPEFIAKRISKAKRDEGEQ